MSTGTIFHSPRQVAFLFLGRADTHEPHEGRHDTALAQHLASLGFMREEPEA